MTQYPLGTNLEELERLRFQHEVWGGITRAFCARIGVARGWRCLDVGCGPGFVALDLSGIVGERGEVVALDESALWIDCLTRELAEHRIANVLPVCARIEEADLPAESFDLVFARWVFSFLPDPAAAAGRLARVLKPGGFFALEDYNHEGISLFPASAGFRAVVRATRALYAGAGGDAFVAGRAPAIFRAAGLETVSIVPNALCGAPGSPVFRWAGRFFPPFSAQMEQKGLLAPEERASFLREWAERERDPEALFFSPFVVDALARKGDAPLRKADAPARTT